VPATEATIVSVDDERTPLAEAALSLIERIFPARDRQPSGQIAMEIAEKRLGLLTLYDFHLLAAVTGEGEVVGVCSGVYLGGVNTGFVTYLAVRKEARGSQLGRQLRVRLIEAFQADAALSQWKTLAAVVGEVRLDSPWLARLYRERSALPLDLSYYHPGQEPGNSAVRWVLYRQSIGDPRDELTVGEVKQLLYAIWRRAYRTRWPLERAGFREMLEQLEGRTIVGAHPEVGDRLTDQGSERGD
jgi:ribosomal protein S18 acetylase RimI-like enzyme